MWAAAGTVVVGTISWGLAGFEMALGVALGALLGVGNLALTARVISHLVSDPQRHRPTRPGALAWPAILGLKWPLLLLALGGVLWYMPARPEGVAIGVALSLAAAAAAAQRRQA